MKRPENWSVGLSVLCSLKSVALLGIWRKPCTSEIHPGAWVGRMDRWMVLLLGNNWVIWIQGSRIYCNLTSCHRELKTRVYMQKQLQAIYANFFLEPRDTGAWVISWSTNCANCINIWVYLMCSISGESWIALATALALGNGWPLRLNFLGSLKPGTKISKVHQ